MAQNTQQFKNKCKNKTFVTLTGYQKEVAK